jgi:predicted RNA-binding protein
MEYKQNTRSPQYGKLIAYDSQGRVVKEFDMLRIVVEHEGVEYTVGQLLSLVHNHAADITILKDRVKQLEEQFGLQQQELFAAKENIKLLVTALEKLSESIKANDIIGE